MSDIEFVGKMSPQPFISMAKEEKMRIEEIKKGILKEKSVNLLTQERKSKPELTYVRDVQEDY